MGTRYVTAEGIQVTSNGDAIAEDFMHSVINLDQNYRLNEALCAGWLRSIGVKLATPDDGWVDHEDHTVTPPSYALFNDRPRVGDKIAFGSPSHDRQAVGTYRLATVSKVTPPLFGIVAYGFRDLEVPIQIPPCKVWWCHREMAWKATEIPQADIPTPSQE